MDTQTTNSQPAATDDPLARVFAKCLLKTLAAAMPPDPSDDRATQEENRQAMQALFASLNPRDPAEAQLAAIAIAAAGSAMDNFVRATQPGVSNDMAIRLRGNALNAGRTYGAMLRTLRGPQPPLARRPAGSLRQAPSGRLRRRRPHPSRRHRARAIRSARQSCPRTAIRCRNGICSHLSRSPAIPSGRLR